MHAFIRGCLLVCMTGLSLPVMAGHCDAGGIGGTGVATDSSADIRSEMLSSADGIGGTGIDVENGIGGTGIVSEIAFNSICVNSLAMHYWTSATSVDDFVLDHTQPHDFGQLTQ